MKDNKISILVLQGPNLNLLGKREPTIYGSDTLADIHAGLKETSRQYPVYIDFFQSNHEGALVDRIHIAFEEGVDGIIINPGAYTHTSIALRDAFAGTQIPFVEIHISNVYSREEFRHHSYLSPLAAGVIAGFGIAGYELALHGLIRKLNKK